MPVPFWQYHEPDHPGQDFDAIAESYDQKNKSFRNVQGEIQEILEFLDLKPDQSVLELGTGTGEFALAAAGCCSRVFAVDLSDGMLSCAQKKAASREIRNIDFIKGGFLTYEHQGGYVDAVVTQIALHHLPDFWKQIALLRMAGLLKEGGRLCLRDVVYSFDVAEYEDYFRKFFSQASMKGGDGFVRLMSDHVRNEYSTLDWIMRGIIERAGFEVASVKHKHGFFALYLCTKR